METVIEITKKDILNHIIKTENICEELEYIQHSCLLNDDDEYEYEYEYEHEHKYKYEHIMRGRLPLPHIKELGFCFSKLIDDDSVMVPETCIDVTFLIGQQIITTTKNMNKKYTLYDKIMILPDNFYLFGNVKFQEINIEISIYTINKINNIETMLKPTIYYTSFDMNRYIERRIITSHTIMFIPKNDLFPMNRPILDYGKMTLGNYMIYSNGMCGMRYIE